MVALQKLSPLPIYEVEEIAKKQGHEVLRTLTEHPELQPIELCWGIVKNHIARNCDFTYENLKLQLEEGFSKVDASTCEKIIRKIKTNYEVWLRSKLIYLHINIVLRFLA